MSTIIKVFAEEKNANEYATKLENSKTNSDGYVEYYVVPYDVEGCAVLCADKN
jgi:predicted DNA-binding WGR domain protein